MNLDQLEKALSEAPVPGKPGALRGDQSATAQKNYADNYDAIFGKKKAPPAPKQPKAAPVKQTQAGKKSNIMTDPALRGKGPAKGNFQSQDSLASGSAAVQAKKAEIAAKKAGSQAAPQAAAPQAAAPQAAAPQAAAPAPKDPSAVPGAVVKIPSGQHFVKGDDGKWIQSDAKGTIDPNASAENPNSLVSKNLDQAAGTGTGTPGAGGVINAPDNSLGAKIGRGIDKVKKAAADAIGGPLATQTRSDPNAGALKKAGATVGAGIGRAMAAVGGMKLPKGQAQAGAEPGAEQPAPGAEQLKPMPGPTASELKMLQKKTLGGDLNAAKNLVNKLSDLKSGGYDADAFIQTAAPAMKRGGLAKSDPQAYANFTKLARSMRQEAYQHLSNVLEAAGFTWEDVGYEVLVSESVSSHVMLIPTSEIQMVEMKKLAGI